MLPDASKTGCGKKGKVMKSGRKLDRCIYGSMMILAVSFLAPQGSLAADPAAGKKSQSYFLSRAEWTSNEKW
jgi:hypothetical protein